MLRIASAQGEEDLTSVTHTDEELLAHGLSDYALPFSEDTLPSIIKEQANTFLRLLKFQAAVRSSSQLMSFKDRALSHRNSTVPPFEPTKQLPVTKGSFGQVESVRYSNSGLFYARKTMLRIRHGTMSDSEAQEDRHRRLRHFVNEVEILKKLDHVHLVHFRGSYADEKIFALLVEPVAKSTLHDLLVQPAPLAAENIATLLSSFGCLTMGLAWLHSNQIRHKDIKPANILIHEGSMLFCDFGSAMDAEFMATTQTEGTAHNRTPRYASPETYRKQKRNEASDVWSLGCVFMEMLTVLTDASVDELLEYIHRQTDKPVPVHDVCYWMGATPNILRRRVAEMANGSRLQRAAAWTQTMVGFSSIRSVPSQLMGMPTLI